jgi:ABC-type protease/lipase transport system fused ATPase/permease subunit
MLALAAPLFTMSVYDRVIPNGAIPSLVALGIGLGLAIAGLHVEGNVIERFRQSQGTLLPQIRKRSPSPSVRGGQNHAREF